MYRFGQLEHPNREIRQDIDMDPMFCPTSETTYFTWLYNKEIWTSRRLAAPNLSECMVIPDAIHPSRGSGSQKKLRVIMGILGDSLAQRTKVLPSSISGRVEQDEHTPASYDMDQAKIDGKVKPWRVEHREWVMKHALVNNKNISTSGREACLTLRGNAIALAPLCGRHPPARRWQLYLTGRTVPPATHTLVKARVSSS
ncbi:uncharacterized protein EI90DRAFT_342130 [Cantharellus anzutake]|uniref:uncharacterized protein n=1 Tax=Cantharellus anzutake TaxID=1750568 RepID=UPI001906412E|nr:uncharacterized protein EI90DRAFT_342130 [Cantharellus anzutake]KAF8315557.1 hypothetical protein EI90DRAFT_342130 [Cantharellus anzutake]